MNHETDYLIIGAGAVGMAFADELLTRTDAHLTIVDKRHAPGGHWNDAYSFVRLHQPSLFYGVESRPLSEARIDTDGVNKGFLSLAEGSEITHYFHSLMRERFLPSGRVSYFPVSEVTADGAIRSLLSGDETTLNVRRKTVDASYHTNSVPKTHTRQFSVDQGVTCVPPNDLPRLAPDFEHYSVLGAGKTAIDACVWLLTNGASPDAITWVMPRDPWLWNRATTQPAEEFFETVFGGFADRQEAIAAATSPEDLAHRLEAAGIWLRLDPAVEPGLFHAATIAERELDELRRINDVVRMGRVTKITTAEMTLEQGAVAQPPQTLFIDCTASALTPREPVPIFAGDRITLQMTRFPQPTFSAAFCAFLEATFEDDAQKNQFAAPLPLPDTVRDYIQSLLPEAMNRFHASKDPQVSEWVARSRLDGFTKIAMAANPADSRKQAILKRVKTSAMQMAENLPRLLQS